MSSHERWFFAAILLLAALLRFVQLGSVPYGVNQDEAERAYDAYSLLRTGHDQHGNPWPLTLEAYSPENDNASAISAYMAIPTTAIFGPGVLAVRIPSAIAGFLAVLAVIVLGKQLSGRWRVGLLAGFAMTVSPWHLTLSRTGHEAVWLPTFLLLGLVALFATYRRSWTLPFVVACWGIGFYGYGPGKLFFPLLAFVTFSLCVKRMQWKPLPVLIGLALVVLFAFPLFHFSNGQFGFVHLQEVSSFSLGWVVGLKDSFLNILLYSNPIIWLQGRLTVGVFDWALVLLGVPLFFLVVRKSITIAAPRLLVGLWLFILVLPAVLTNNNPHQLRAAGLVGVIHIVGAWGIFELLERSPKRSIPYMTRAFLVAGGIAAACFGVLLFWRPAYALRIGYAKATPSYTPEVATLVRQLEDTYPDAAEVYINDMNLNQPQIFFMLFTPWNPRTVQADHTTYIQPNGWYRTAQLGRYHFCYFDDCPKDRPGAIYVEAGRYLRLGKELLNRIPIQGFAPPGIWWVISRNPSV